VHLDAELLRAAGVRRVRAAILQADGPVVQRAGHAGAEHDALRQRPAFVRTAVQEREHLVLAVAEHGHMHASRPSHAARAERGDVFHAADHFPVAHTKPFFVIADLIRNPWIRGQARNDNRWQSRDAQRLELPCIHPCLVEFEPRIGLAFEAELQAPPQRLAAFAVVQDLLLHVVQTDSVHVMHRALQVPTLLAIQLQEGVAVLQHLGRGLELAEELRDLGLDAAIAGDVDFPARVDADDADVLDTRFGAIAWAARDRELDFVGRVHAPEGALEVLAHLSAVLRAEAAPLAAHARLHRAQRLGIGMARGHTEVFPDAGEVFLLHAQQVDALAARDLDGRHLVFVHHVGDTAQLTGGRFAAPHARDDRVRAVFLNVRVAALVDVAALRIVLRLLWPSGDQVIVDGRAARGAAVGRAPFHEAERLRDAQQFVRPDRVAHFLVAVVGAAAQGFLFGRGRVVAARGGHQDLLHQARARSAGRAGLGVLAHLVDCEQALFLDRLADRALVHAVAAAHFGVGGHRG